MKKHTLVFIFTSVLSFHTLSAQAIVIDLFEWAFNIDGTFYSSFTDALPIDGTLDASGLGTTLSTEFTTAGSHLFIAYFDYEIDEATNTFFNEFGATSGSLALGQSWEIDDPFFGDIYFNVMNGTLDNTNSFPLGSEEDISFAIGWDFNLLAGETVNISLNLTETLNNSIFELEHKDADSGGSVFFNSSLVVQTVSEPPSLTIFIIGLLGLGIVNRRRFVNSRKAEYKLLTVS